MTLGGSVVPGLGGGSGGKRRLDVEHQGAGGREPEGLGRGGGSWGGMNVGDLSWTIAWNKNLCSLKTQCKTRNAHTRNKSAA